MSLEILVTAYLGAEESVREQILAFAVNATNSKPTLDYKPDPATGVRSVPGHQALITELEDIADQETGARARHARQLLALNAFQRSVRFFWLFDRPIEHRVWSNAALQSKMHLARYGIPALPSQYDHPADFKNWTKSRDGKAFGLPVDTETELIYQLQAIVNDGLENGVPEIVNVFEGRS